MAKVNKTHFKFKTIILLILSIYLFFIISLIPLVSSIDTPIIVKNLGADENFILRIQDHYTNETIERIELSSNKNGEFSYTLSTNNSMQRLNFKLMIIENQKITNTKYLEGEYFTGKPITLDYESDNLGSSAEESLSETDSASTNQTNSTTNSTGAEVSSKETSDSPKITGKTIVNIKEIFSKIKYYLFAVIGILILAFITFLIIKKRRSSKPYSDIFHTVYNNSDGKFKQLPYSPSSKEHDSRIIGAEKKIKELENEIVKIKKEQLIKSAEKKIEQDRQELEKLKRGAGFY